MFRPVNSCGNELSISTARDGLNGDAECLTGLGQSFAPVAKIAERRTLEAAIGEFTQNRDYGFCVMTVRRHDIDCQGDAVSLDRDLDLDAMDLLAAINCCATIKTTVQRQSATQLLVAGLLIIIHLIVAQIEF